MSISVAQLSQPRIPWLRLAKRMGMQSVPRTRLREKLRVARAERKRPSIRKERDFVR